MKLWANMGKLSKNRLTSVSVKDWCMSPHGVTRPSEQSSRNSWSREISFYWPDSQRRQISPRCDKYYARYPLSKKLCPPWKSRPKFTLGHQICHQSIGRTRVYIDTVVTLALCCFVSEISLVLCCKCHYCTYPFVFRSKFGDVSIRFFGESRRYFCHPLLPGSECG